MANVGTPNLETAQGRGGQRPAKGPQDKAAKKKEKKERAPRKMGPLRAALLTFLFILFLLAACLALLYFDLFGLRAAAIDLLTMGDNPYTRQIDELAVLSDSIAQDSALLESERAAFESEKQRVEKLEKDVLNREAALKAREDEITVATDTLTVTQENMDQLIAMYEQMPPAQSAAVMTELFAVEDIARILERLEDKTAAAILGALDPQIAARVTELMLGS